MSAPASVTAPVRTEVNPRERSSDSHTLSTVLVGTTPWSMNVSWATVGSCHHGRTRARPSPLRSMTGQAVDGTDPDDLYDILSAEVKAKKASAAVKARFSPEASPVPIIALPISRITARTSAKSRLMRPSLTIRSVMQATPE